MILFCKSCFELGLKSEIRKEVHLHRPTSLDQAIDLAKVVEDKIREGNLSSYPNRSYNATPSKNFHTSTPKSESTTIYIPKFSLPIKKLTSTELAEKGEKGLCYNCDKKIPS